MIVDCHGHFTTAPQALWDWRKDQVGNKKPDSRGPKISDDEIRHSLEPNQLKLQKERGSDVTFFSPRAGSMEHHVGDAGISLAWSQVCNDLIHRACRLYPRNFAPVCQLPQSPGVRPENCVRELDRCVGEMGFIGCNLNPDPSGGYWKEPPLTDKWWYPVYEKLVELDVPAMVHVSSSCNPAVHFTGAHYINADTTAFMQLITADLFKDFPTLKFVIPHGGGGVPYHWGRLLRHLRLPPAGHRPAAQGDPGRQHPVRLGDGRRRARHRPRDRALLRRHEALHREQQKSRSQGKRKNIRKQRAPRLFALEARLARHFGQHLAALRQHRISMND